MTQNTRAGPQWNGCRKTEFCFRVGKRPRPLRGYKYYRAEAAITELKQLCNEERAGNPRAPCAGLIHSYRKGLVEVIAAKRGQPVINSKASFCFSASNYQAFLVVLSKDIFFEFILDTLR